MRKSEVNRKVVFVKGDVFSQNLYDELGLEAACPFCRRGGFNGTAYGLNYVDHSGMEFFPCIYVNKPCRAEVRKIVADHLDSVTAKGIRRFSICPLAICDGNGREADEALMDAVYSWLGNGGEKKVEKIFVVDLSSTHNLVCSEELALRKGINPL